MCDKVIKLPAAHQIDRDLILMCEELLERARDGILIGLAVVEHHRGDAVAITVSMAGSYHHINSGAARLAFMLASQQQTIDG